MRIILLIATVFSFTVVRSQTVSSFGLPAYSEEIGLGNNILTHNSISKQKWFLTTNRSLYTGISFFNGGNATIIAAPMSLQLNRRLNDNLYAFANVSATPAFISLNPSLINMGFNKTNQQNIFGPNSFGVYPSASLGLMYINDAKTFSIFGSISAERSSYPILPVYNRRQNPDVHSKR
jgi:hypothetical protein